MVKGGFLRSLGILSMGLLLHMGTATADSTVKPVIRDPKVSDIFVPRDIGYVVERHEPGADVAHPLLILHIQEAHTNYDAQKHLVKILERFVEDYGLGLILVEGGEGDVSLAYLRNYGSPENRRQVADKYLKAGIISGEEYLDIVSDYSLDLWGVERKALYEQNLEAFLHAQALRGEFESVLASVRQAIEILLLRVADPALAKLDADAKAFEEERLSLNEYALSLESLARQHDIDPDLYPTVFRYLDVRDLEETMSPATVQQEQQTLMEQLTQRLEETAQQRLVALALEMQAGKATRAEFYTEMERLSDQERVSLSSYPDLANYIRYVQLSDQIGPKELGDDLDALTHALRQQLVSSPEGRRLNEMSEHVGLVEKLVALQLSPEEYARLQVLDLPSAMVSWETYLTGQAAAHHGISPSKFRPLQALREQLPALQRFYDVAGERDQVLVDNSLARAMDTDVHLAVLITGGFHSPKITEMLKARGVGVVVIAPKVTQPTNERLYHAVLKYKSGHGSFDEVMAIADNAWAMASPSANSLND